MSDEILLEVSDGVAVITFNRPDAMNTFTAGMMDRLGEAYRRCDEDDAVKVVVLTGAGKAFCAGADMSGGGDTFDTQGEMNFSSCPLSFQAWDVRKPVIAALNGHAIGVGMGIAIQADIRVLAEEGKYGFLQNRRGVVADFAVEYVLPKIVGMERAFELVVRALRLTGKEALEWGLGSRCVPADQVLETALEIARDMAVNCSPLVMGIHKRLMWKGQNMQRDDFVALETKMLHHTMGRADAVEGGMAYVERRDPRWSSSVTQEWPEELN
ncbi:MAG: enoyl-CoA hydratase/isomerase family protein [Proteobacteria bacterium]|nr:enoyl-CoA hydratase/isomerase family protein [Pseudomonadota bacterium]